MSAFVQGRVSWTCMIKSGLSLQSFSGLSGLGQSVASPAKIPISANLPIKCSFSHIHPKTMKINIRRQEHFYCQTLNSITWLYGPENKEIQIFSDLFFRIVQLKSTPSLWWDKIALLFPDTVNFWFLTVFRR